MNPAGMLWQPWAGGRGSRASHCHNSVRGGGTESQLQAVLQPRRHKILAHSISGSTEATAAPGYQPCIPALLQEMWKLKCGNIVKEPYWRLVLDAITTAQRRRTDTE